MSESQSNSIVRKLSKTTLLNASKLNKRIEERYLSFVTECESYRTQHLRPHYCEHGTNLWTDYDNICGGCENGITMGDPLQRMRLALDESIAFTSELHTLISAYVAFYNLLPNTVQREHEETFERITASAIEALQERYGLK